MCGAADTIVRAMSAGEISAIYRDLMRFKPSHLTANGWAVKAGVSRTVWADMRRHGNPSRRTLEKLLVAAGSSLAEFEALRLGPEPAGMTFRPAALGEPGSARWGALQLPPLPVLATRLGGEWGETRSAIELVEVEPDEVVGRAARPASLANQADAYALTIVGDAMWPRFRPGRLIAVAPRASVAVGDDVIVRLKPVGREDGHRLLIKELVRRTGRGIELRQFNPAITFEVGEGEIDAIEKVLGELI
jgi:hypothetical protein